MRLSYVGAIAISTLIANANVVEIAQGMPYVEVEANGKTYKIERVQEPDTYLTNTLAVENAVYISYTQPPITSVFQSLTFSGRSVIASVSTRDGQ